jgi:predicted nucleotidyltransferase
MERRPLRLTRTALLTAVADTLREWDDAIDIEAAFIYGSVATGTAGPGSDIDLFVITARSPAPAALAALRTRSLSMQTGLGFRPDLDYPVEVFTAGACESLLDGQELRAAFAAAVAGPVSAAVVDADALEVARSLTGPAIDVVAAPVLDTLRAHAAAALDAAWAQVPVESRAAVASQLRLPVCGPP